MSIAKSGQKSVLKEIGSKFSGVNIVSSTGEQRIFHTPDVPSIVVATPQAIPVAAAGYKSIIVLNAEAFFTRPILDLNEEVFHQFKYIKSLLQNGQERALVISGEITDSFMNSFISDEVSAFADFELQQREQLGLPPHRNSLVVSGQRREVEGFKKYFDDDPRVTTMGPVASYQKSVFQIAILHNDPAHYISKARNLLKTLSTKGASTLQIQVDPVDFI
jgi:primosomal protein N' (replication factor Y)